mmetsp:Transcript_6717/g.7791  ORF Transcript_6717/g.7791 Transcript_6717/m.7791 type:complete len:82 (+) Transcript_6717:1056-1301(+)
MKLHAHRPQANYFEQMWDSSELKWVFLFLSPPPNTTRKPMLPIFLCFDTVVRVSDLADVCADVSALADTSAARTTARILCT